MDNGIRHGPERIDALITHKLGNKLTVYAPQSCDHRAEEVHVGVAGREGENAVKCGLIQPANHRIFARTGLCTARLPIHERHFAEKIAPLNKSQRLLIATTTGF